MPHTFPSLADALNTLAASMTEALKDGTMRAAVYVAGELKTEVRGEFPEGRTGALSQSFKPYPLRTGSEVGAKATSDLVYAGILDRGGTIFPRTTSRLAVPLKRLPVGKWPRHFGEGELKYIPARGNKDPLLVKANAGKKKGKNKGKLRKSDLMFVLKRSVRIRGRGYVDTVYQRTLDEVKRIMNGAVAKRVDKEVGDGNA